MSDSQSFQHIAKYLGHLIFIKWAARYFYQIDNRSNPRMNLHKKFQATLERL